MVEFIFDKKIIIPGMISYEKDFKISSSFFLIICQNNVGIIGRSELPPLLLRKIRNINYPKLEESEIENICYDIDEFLIKKDEDKVKMIGKDECKKIGK